MTNTHDEKGFAGFLAELAGYMRGADDRVLKLIVLLGFILHISFLISLKTGWWDSWFHDSRPRVTLTASGSINSERRMATDFFAIYLAASELREGHSIYTIEHLQEYREYMRQTKGEQDLPPNDYFSKVPYFDPFRYLPAGSYIGLPLSLLPPWAAYYLWVVFYEMLFFGSILWLGYNFASPRKTVIASAMYLFFTPFYPELYQGQFSFLQSFLILGMLISAGNAGSKYMGWWAASVMWKINTAICLPAVIRWRGLRPLLMLVILLLVTCVPYFIWRPMDIARFAMINFRPPGPADSGSFGLQGMISKIFIDLTNGVDTPMRMAVQYASMLLVVIIGLWVTFKAPVGRFAECLCMWVAAYFLVYIDVWEHQYVMLLPVIAWLYLKKPSIRLWVIWLVMALPSTYKFLFTKFYISVQSGVPVDLLKDTSLLNDWHFTLIKPLALVAMFVYCVWAALRTEIPTGSNVRNR